MREELSRQRLTGRNVRRKFNVLSLMFNYSILESFEIALQPFFNKNITYFKSNRSDYGFSLLMLYKL